MNSSVGTTGLAAAGHDVPTSRLSIGILWPLAVKLDGQPVAIEAGRLGTLSAVLVRLAQAQRAAGQIDDAQASLQRASAQPGPCRALMIDHLDRRLRDLA